MKRENEKLMLRYGSKQFSAFICHGLWAYINECYNENYDVATIRSETQTLLRGHSAIGRLPAKRLSGDWKTHGAIALFSRCATRSKRAPIYLRAPKPSKRNRVVSALCRSSNVPLFDYR